ncbi:MAG: hypothetical protein K0Q51_1477 [Rickettsiaceae bacterium]|jgi:tetratricopeptide (TPR) repeat protein/DNA-binding CsgD family transcriptional regulator|nr:hypothetical protein [Rickettsiaceae bacterium]
MSSSKYSNELNIINGVKFTAREIDIISCIFHNRGEKKIASLLAISPRTVSTHVHNIMLKIGHSSREHLIDFIEKSNKLTLVKKHYSHLLLSHTFNNKLLEIGRILNKGMICYLDYKEVPPEEQKILNKIQEDLASANIKLEQISNGSQNKSSRLCIVRRPSSNSVLDNDNIYLLLLNNNKPEEGNGIKYIDFTQADNYYFAVLELLSKLLGNTLIEPIKEEFNKEYNSIINIRGQGYLNHINNETPKVSNYKIIIVIACAIIFIFITSLIFSRFSTINSDKLEAKICADLPLPHDSILLKRKGILLDIEKKFASKDGIKTIALIGAGGSGKTTIARQYARKQDAPVVWEINAETKASLISSLEQFAYALCKTSDERNELTIIQNMKDSIEQEKRLLLLLTNKLKTYSDWLIIYNNVNTFKDIRRYFPYDARVWGNGKVIVTTCDSNIGFNSFIPAENVIQISGLSKEKRSKLFSNIINEGKKTQDKPEAVIYDFIERIPPYPLDISVAAYCIKEAKLTYSEYLKYISEPREDFLSVQEIVLNDMGEYNKTRYDIVALSIKQIIGKHPEFKNLLLFVSMIDSESIPQDLLIAYKDNILVSQFMHELRKFSLINENMPNSNDKALFSIHRTTQTIALRYLIKECNLGKNYSISKELSGALETYIINELKKDHFIKRPLLVSHVEVFLSHKDLLDKLSTSSLASKLGTYYFYIGAYPKAKMLLEESLAIYKEYYGEKHIKTAELCMRLGNVYRNMGDYIKARFHLEQALNVYKDYYGKDSVETSKIITYLGSVHRNLGQYDKAKELLESSYKTFRTKYDIDNIQSARSSAYLGSVYKNIGEYQNAKILLEPALKTYKKYYGPEHAQTAWISVRLGNVYNSMGEYNTAKQLIEEALNTYKKHHGENCIETAWSLTYLGTIYANLGDSIKAKELLNQSLSIYYDHFDANHISVAWALYNFGKIYIQLGEYEKAEELLQVALKTHETVYGNRHIQTANVVNSLGEVYLLTNRIELAEAYLEKALKIYKQTNHPDIYLTLEAITDLNMKKSTYAVNQGNLAEAERFRKSSIICLKEALGIANKHFTKHSAHIKRINSKLKNLEIKREK